MPSRCDGYFWPTLLDFERLRNCIVHAGGVLADDRDPTRVAGIIKRTEGVAASCDGEINVELAYCRKLIATAQQFFSTCFDTAGFIPKYDFFPDLPIA